MMGPPPDAVGQLIRTVANERSPGRPGAEEHTFEGRGAAFDRLDALAVVIDRDGTVLDTNLAWRTSAELNGGHASTGPGTNYLHVCDAASEPEALAAAAGIRAVLRGDRDEFELEYACDSPLEDRWFLLQVHAVSDRGRRGAILLHRDITSRRWRETNLLTNAQRDPTTGLPNRVALEQLLRHESSLRRTPRGTALVAVHLDELDEVERERGRSVADELVLRLAGRLRRVVRADDVVSRVDDRCLVVACSSTTDEDAERTGERIRAALGAPVQIGSTVVVPAIRISSFDLVPTHEDADASAAPTHHSTPGRAALVALKAIQTHSNDVALLFLGDGTITWVSASCRRVFGLDPEDLVGRNGMDLIIAEDRDRAVAAFMSIPGAGEQVRVEFRVRAVDGSIRWLEELATNCLDEPGIGAIVGNLRDITDRKEAERSVEFQARLLAAVGQAVVSTDADRRVLYWNDAAEDLYGWSAQEALGRHIAELCPAAPGWEHAAVEISDAMSRGEPWSGEFHLLRRDGSLACVMVTDTPVFDDDGHQIATIAAASDLTEQLRGREAAARLAAIVECSSDAIFSTAPDGVVASWNRAAEELFGWPEHDVVGRPARDLAPPDERLALDQLLTRVTSGTTIRDLQFVHVRPDGSEVLVSLSVSPIRGADGTAIGVSGIARDVTDHAELLERLETDHQRLAVAQQTARLGSFEIDLSTGSVVRSAELQRILGLGDDDIHTALFDTVHPDDRADVLAALDELIGGSEVVERTYRIVRPDGETRWVRVRASRLHQGAREGLAGIVLDVTDQHEAQLALARQATCDPLTGLPNRTGLHAALSKALALEPDRRIALAILDLDRFKVINDTLGHRIGDETLRAVADRLRSHLRPDDLVARLGGDEFVLMRTGVDTLEHARGLAEDASAALRAPIVAAERSFELSASIGVTLSAPVDSPESLLSDADAAMYDAKHAYTGVAVFDDRARQRSTRRLEIEAELRGAIERDELAVHYQPVVDLHDGTIRGFEALARWMHPRLGPIGPDEFIPIAESCGLIVALGDRITAAALEQLSRWRADPRTPADLWLAINLSSAQLGTDTFVARFASMLDHFGVPGRNVHLEITESILVGHIGHAFDTLSALRRLGALISIDDFGTGFSSLSYLDRLPVDVVKIDRSFIDRIGPDTRDTPVVRSIVALATTLDLHVIAEGIENEAQLDVVRELGCGLGQGFLWSPAVPAETAHRLLRDRLD